MKKALYSQVGGNHYQNMPYQPVILFAKTKCTAFQANIWKYITRYKNKNGKEDIEKCIHYAALAKELKCKGFQYRNVGPVFDFCRKNKLPKEIARIVTLALFDEYDKVIECCKRIIETEYPSK